MSGGRTRWWPWFRALQALAPTEGALVTGVAWSVHCWDWRSGLSEEDVLARVAAPTLEDFRQLRQPEINERTVRRHFAQLQEAGLLERRRGHSRHGPDVYVPRVPTTAASADVDEDLVVEDAGAGPVEEADTGHQSPVSGTGQQRTRVPGVGQQRTLVPGVERPNTGHSAPQHRTFGDTPPFLSEGTQNPPARGRADAGAREGASARARDGGGSWTPEEEERADRALEEVLRAMPADLAPKVAAKYRRRCRTWLLSLLAVGWQLRDVVQEVARPSWGGVVSPGGTLAARLEALTEQPAPRAPVPLPAKCDRCDVNRMVETGQGQAYCPTCHPYAGRTSYVRQPLPPPASNETRRALLDQARRELAARRAGLPVAEQQPAAESAAAAVPERERAAAGAPR